MNLLKSQLEASAKNFEQQHYADSSTVLKFPIYSQYRMSVLSNVNMEETQDQRKSHIKEVNGFDDHLGLYIKKQQYCERKFYYGF